MKSKAEAFVGARTRRGRRHAASVRRESDRIDWKAELGILMRGVNGDATFDGEERLLWNVGSRKAGGRMNGIWIRSDRCVVMNKRE